MKAIKCIPLFLAAGAILLSGCKKKKDEEEGLPDPNTNPPTQQTMYIKSVTSGGAIQGAFYYDSNHRLITQVNNPNDASEKETMQLEYNTGGKLVKIHYFNNTDKEDYYELYQYNTQGQLIRMQEFWDWDHNGVFEADHGYSTYEYNTAGKLIKLTFDDTTSKKHPVIDKWKNKHKALSGLTRKASRGFSDYYITYEYNSIGNLIKKSIYDGQDNNTFELIATMEYVFDTKNNYAREWNLPVLNELPVLKNNFTQIKITDMIFSYITTTNITYEYNSSGYPVKSTSKTTGLPDEIGTMEYY